MKNSFSTLLLAILFAGFATTSCVQQGFTIQGTISGDNAEGAKVHLIPGRHMVTDVRMSIDSTVISNGTFEFKGELPTAEMLTVMILLAPPAASTDGRPGRASQHVIPLFLDQGTVTIDAAIDQIPLVSFDLTYSYDYTHIKITGPKLNDLFVDYMMQKFEYVQAFLEVNRDYIAYSRSRGAPISQGVEAITKVLEAKENQKEFAKRFIKDNAENLVGLYAFLDNMDEFTLAEINETEVLLSPKMKEDAYGKMVLEQAAAVKGSAIGAKYIDFTFEDSDGKSVRLSDHLGKGNTVLLEFWASWCGPCRAEIPHLKQVYEAYNSVVGFDIVGVSLDTDKGAWFRALEQEQMAWHQLSDTAAFQGDLPKAYNFRGIPACILIGPDSTIIGRNMRGSYLDKKMIDLYGNKFGDKF